VATKTAATTCARCGAQRGMGARLHEAPIPATCNPAAGGRSRRPSSRGGRWSDAFERLFRALRLVVGLDRHRASWVRGAHRAGSGAPVRARCPARIHLSDARPPRSRRVAARPGPQVALPRIPPPRRTAHGVGRPGPAQTARKPSRPLAGLPSTEADGPPASAGGPRHCQGLGLGHSPGLGARSFPAFPAGSWRQLRVTALATRRSSVRTTASSSPETRL